MRRHRVPPVGHRRRSVAGGEAGRRAVHPLEAASAGTGRSGSGHGETTLGRTGKQRSRLLRVPFFRLWLFHQRVVARSRPRQLPPRFPASRVPLRFRSGNSFVFFFQFSINWASFFFFPSNNWKTSQNRSTFPFLGQYFRFLRSKSSGILPLKRKFRPILTHSTEISTYFDSFSNC